MATQRRRTTLQQFIETEKKRKKKTKKHRFFDETYFSQRFCTDFSLEGVKTFFSSALGPELRVFVTYCLNGLVDKRRRTAPPAPHVLSIHPLSPQPIYLHTFVRDCTCPVSVSYSFLSLWQHERMGVHQLPGGKPTSVGPVHSMPYT